MASSIDKLAKELKKQMTASDERKPKPYDTQAEVLRVEDGVAWVHIPGGVDETPVRLTINAKKGDNVNLHVANGTAWITGNSTNPPTDDSTANYAVNISNEVKKDITVLNTVVAENIEATNARFINVEADTAKIHTLTAEKILATVGYIEDLTADSITTNDISAASGYIKDLTADSITAQDISAASGYIKDLEAENITAQDITADHATVGSLDANYAHITDGVIDNAKIGYADVNNLSANYAQINLANVNNAWIENGVVKDAAISDAQILGVSANKLTAGTIDASNITVTNLNASNITTGSITVDGITIDVENNEASIDGSYIEDGTITMNGFAQEVKDVIDGAIETFTGTVVPTLNNAPANAWTTTKLKDQHIGDVYYVVNASSKQNGYCYRFSKSGSTYSWQLIKDSDVTAALQRLQTAEGKISNIESFDEEMATFKTETEGEISTLQTKTTSLETSLGDKVDKTVFNEVKQTVDGNSASITELSTITTNNGLAKTTNITNTVNAVSQTATGNSSKISSLTNTLGTNADGTTKAGDIVHRTSAVEQDLSGFKTTVSKTYHKTSDFNTYKAANDTAVAAAKKAGDDAQADLDEYKGTVSETYATKSSLTQTAEGIRTDVSSTYETKTDASAKLTEAKGDATTKANKALTDAKADTTNKLKSYYTKTETDSAITQKAGEISLSVAQTEISKIEVGGRNRASLSYIWNRTADSYITNGITFTNLGDGRFSAKGTATNAGDIWWCTADRTSTQLGSGGTYTYSIYLESGTMPSNIGLQVAEADSSSWKRNNRSSGGDTKYTFSTNSGNHPYHLGFYAVTANATIDIVFKLKFEEGNKATDWSPAPEDLEAYTDSQVSAAKAEIKVTTDGISTRVGKTETKLAGMYATSSTAAGTAAKVATIAPALPSGATWELGTGTIITVKFTNANTAASPTLNVNSKGAKAIKTYANGNLTEAEYKWKAGSTFTFTYNGTNWLMQDSTNAVRLTSAETVIEQTANNVLIKATKSDTTDVAAGKKLIESFINVNPETVKISAKNVEIDGATTFNAIKESADAAYDKKGAASTAVSGKADKTAAVAEEQLIYISKASGTTSVSGTTTWITETGNKQNTWSTKRPTYNSSYPVLFVAKQKKVVSGTVTCTTPIKDDTTTIIDGGHITTGTIDTNRLDANTIKSNIVQTTDLNASKITAGDISADRMKVNSIAAINSLTTGKIDAARINVGQITVGSLSDGSSYSTTTQMKTAIGNAVSGIEIGGRNLVLNTANMPAGGTNGWRASGGAVTHITITDPPIAGISGGIRVKNSGTSAARIGLAQDNRYNTFVAGEKYSQSFWIRASSSFTSTVDCQPIWSTSSQTTGSISKSMTLTTSWQYVKGEGATLKGTQADYYSAGYVYASNVPAGAYIEVCADKVEKGTKATDWTPSPEDTLNDNYLIDTQKMSQWYLGSRVTRSTSNEFGELTFTGSTADWGCNAVSQPLIKPSILDGRPLWLSFEYTATATANRVYLNLQGSSAKEGTFSNVRSKYINQVVTLQAASSWTKFSVQVPSTVGELVSGSGDVNGLFVAFYVYNDNVTVKMRKVKLEHGISSTPWTPSPEDFKTYVTRIDDAGIRIHPSNTENNSIVINASGMEVFQGGTTGTYSVAKYGDTARIGKNASRHINISESGFDVYQNNVTAIASVSYGTGAAESGTAEAPYYILGSYLDLSPAPANYSISGGVYSEALGYCSRAIGYYVKTNYAHQTAIGKFNDNNSNNVFEIGWGTSDSARKNIFAVKADGTAEINGSSMTDFVIEQGNGYRKWNSGIAECWVTATKNVALNGAYGSLYQGTWTWTFPITFNANPAVTCSLFRWGTGASWGAVSAATTTNATLRGIDAFSRASGSCNIAAYAIGRWK